MSNLRTPVGRVTLLGLFLWLSTTVLVQSQPSPAHYSLAELKEMARVHNPTLVQAQALIQGEEGKALQAGLWPNPTIGYEGTQIGLNGTAGDFQGGFLRQKIVTGGKLELSRQKYEARADAARNNAVAQKIRVENDVESSFYATVGADARLQIYDDLLNMAKDHYKTTVELVNVGNLTQADLKMAGVKLQKARLDRFMGENELKQQRASLEAVIGVPLVGASLQGSPQDRIDQPVPDWETLLARTLEQSPLVLAAQDKLRSDELTVQREEAEPIPDLIVQGGAGNNNVDHQVVYMAGLSLQIPLFDQNQGTIQQAQADLSRQKAELERIRLNITRDFAREYSLFLTQYQKVLDYQNIVLPRSREAYEMQLQMYKAHRINWHEVLATQQHYLNNRLDWIGYLVDFQRHRVAVEGFLLQNGLQVPDSPTPPSHIDAVPKPR